MPVVNETLTPTGVVTPTVVTKFKIVGNNRFSDYAVNEILSDIAERINSGRRLIIPIGLPQSGKSMFIASLIAYAFRRDPNEDNSCNFNVLNRDASGITAITQALDDRKTLPSTTEGTFSIIDLDMESRYRKGKKIKVSFVDLSGEDVERLIGVRPDKDGIVAKIQNLLQGCIAHKAIFSVISPVDEKLTEVGEVSAFDKNEGTRMKQFIDQIKMGSPDLYKKTKILMVVTKWDKIPTQITSSKFMKIHRNELYNEYLSNSVSYGLLPYSVGNVVANTIMKIDLCSPKNFWYTLYRWWTGKHVLPWWKRIFS